MNTNGEQLHSWPNARVNGRAKLTRKCTLLFIGNDYKATEMDWDGRTVWEHQGNKGHLLHHDIAQLRNGNNLLLYNVPRVHTDYLLEVDREKKIVWKWDSAAHLKSYFLETSNRADITHINSIQELPDNELFENGDERFAPGNILLSLRNLNRIVVISRKTGSVTWSYADKLDHQHEALMIEKGKPHAGRILLFDNGLKNLYRRHKSRILIINPVTNQIEWKYEDRFFYSKTAGVASMLNNGNVLVTSSESGRVFQLDQKKRIVWQWTPPYLPMRPTLYDYSYCPQLKSLPRREPKKVTARPAYVDKHLYNSLTREDLKVVAGIGRVIKGKYGCKELILPSRPRIRFGYGLLKDVEHPVDFEATIESGGQQEILFQTSIRKRGKKPHRKKTDLSKYAYKSVKLCLKDSGGSRLSYWIKPVILSVDYASGPMIREPLSEKKLQELRALGYVQ